MKRWKSLLYILLNVLFLCGCSMESDAIVVKQTIERSEPKEISKTVTYRFVDDYSNEYEATANPNVKKCAYQKAAFLLDGDRMSYGQTEYGYRFGIDVSYYQEEIDWQRVKADGVEFVFIRLGYRGYSDGALCLDEKFVANIQGAQSAGIDVGIYFFAQAVSEAEAIEEAEYVLKQIEGYSLQMPIAYDVEDIDDDVGRMDDISVNQRSKNAAAFCKTIEEAGYDAMVYCNMYYEAYKLDLEQLAEYSIWYADYNRYPQTPYHFDVWQYTDKGKVDGISGYVDLNIQMVVK